MNISEEHRERIEDIISGMQRDKLHCVKDFECYTSELESLCKIKGIGSFDEIECDSMDAMCCHLSFEATGKRFCKCPLRRYISVNFHR